MSMYIYRDWSSARLGTSMAGGVRRSRVVDPERITTRLLPDSHNRVLGASNPVFDQNHSRFLASVLAIGPSPLTFRSKVLPSTLPDPVIETRPGRHSAGESCEQRSCRGDPRKASNRVCV